MQVWSCAPCSARAPRGTKRLCRDPRGSRASSKAEHTKALRAARAPALAGGTQQWSDRGDPGAHTPSRRARIASRSRRSRAHSPWRVCGIPEIWTPGRRVGRRGTHLLLPGPSQDPKVQVSPPATDLCVRIYVFILFPSSVEVSPSRCASGEKRTSPSATPPPPPTNSVYQWGRDGAGGEAATRGRRK